MKAAKVLTDRSLVEQLISAGTGGTPEFRAAVIEALAANQDNLDPRARLLFFHGMSDGSPLVRLRAMEAATAIERSASLRYALLDHLIDSDTAVRALAAAKLVTVGGEEVFYELFRASHDRSPEVRRALYHALVAHPLPKFARDGGAGR